MVETTLARNTLAGALGAGEYAALMAVGWLGDRFASVYQLDAHLSAKRLGTLLARQEAADRADPGGLRWSEQSVFSQNGEDGVIHEIFRRIGTSTEHFVEIGASDGTENCTRNLVENGWSGVWIEADQQKAAKAGAVSPNVRVICQPAKRDTIAHLLRQVGVPPSPDLLVVDIDSDDLGILRAAVPVLEPRVIVVEYNAAFTHHATWALPAGRFSGWDGTFRHGASLRALDSVAAASGYSLVHCDTMGVNAFFVRSDLAAPFAAAGHRRRLWRVGAFTAHPFGHPRSRRALAPMQPINIEHLRAVTIERVVQLTQPGPPFDLVELVVTICNGSPRWLTSGEPNAFHLSLRWLDGDSPRPPATPRTSLPRPIAPGATAALRLWTRRPDGPGPHRMACDRVVRGRVLAGQPRWTRRLRRPRDHRVTRTPDRPSPGSVRHGPRTRPDRTALAHASSPKLLLRSRHAMADAVACG